MTAEIKQKKSYKGMKVFTLIILSFAAGMFVCNSCTTGGFVVVCSAPGVSNEGLGADDE